ncbi:hypothetical protein BLNAU_5912 [Blattamonas nauphoetae]|uniref:Uncharacterized protein n=1 Tax=Blattamonas nauphoetae TaxID=2049346 RepID=A0ABQ9Y5T3_9EUKA|nr:hypothetical protein BLNAU_5912 [Blattamonas nauphoetae]
MGILFGDKVMAESQHSPVLNPSAPLRECFLAHAAAAVSGSDGFDLSQCENRNRHVRFFCWAVREWQRRRGEYGDHRGRKSGERESESFRQLQP